MYVNQTFSVSHHNDQTKQNEDRTKREDDFQDLSLKFIREVKHLHGGDKAKAVIESLSETLGKQWSSRIIFDMIARTDEIPSYARVTIRVKGQTLQKIPLIKGFRWLTGCGLKEAKDAIESLASRVEIWEDKLAEMQRYPNYREAPYIEIALRADVYEEAAKEYTNAGGIIL